jgi:hypothetical protein
MDADGLRSVRNAFYLGLYAEVAKEVAQLPRADKELQGTKRQQRLASVQLEQTTQKWHRIFPA